MWLHKPVTTLKQKYNKYTSAAETQNEVLQIMVLQPLQEIFILVHITQ